MGGDLPSLLRVVLGAPESIANRWCVFGKLNLRLVFDDFSGLGLPKGEVFLGSTVILCGPSDVYGGL